MTTRPTSYEARRLDRTTTPHAYVRFFDDYLEMHSAQFDKHVMARGLRGSTTAKPLILV